MDEQSHKASLKNTFHLEPKRKLDLRGVLCPFNFVKIKIELEQMASGEYLSVLLDQGEPAKNVKRSLLLEKAIILKETIHEQNSSIYFLIQK